MKTMTCIPAILAILFVYACNNSAQQSQASKPEPASAPVHASAADQSTTQTVSAAFTTLDPAAAEVIHGIIGHYLTVKNALASDNPADAAKAATMLRDALKKLDKSRLTVEQKTAFDKSEGSIRDQASLIADSGGDIAKQRDAFFPLSESISALARQFGGGKTLYVDFCPMARDNQGATWISEQKDIRNPYFGSGMLTCGSVKETIQ